MGPFESLVKPTNPFSEKCILNASKDTLMQILYLCSTVYIIDRVTKETNYAQIQFRKYHKNQYIMS
jgi:hypothetical protein